MIKRLQPGSTLRQAIKALFKSWSRDQDDWDSEQQKSTNQKCTAAIWPLHHWKSSNQELQKRMIEWSSLENLDPSCKHFNRWHMTILELWDACKWTEWYQGKHPVHLICFLTFFVASQIKLLKVYKTKSQEKSQEVAHFCTVKRPIVDCSLRRCTNTAA